MEYSDIRENIFIFDHVTRVIPGNVRIFRGGFWHMILLSKRSLVPNCYLYAQKISDNRRLALA